MPDPPVDVIDNVDVVFIEEEKTDAAAVIPGEVVPTVAN